MIPQDPFILLSWVNTQLRDNYPSLADLCGGEDVSREDLIAKLAAIGYRYDEAQNRFC